MLRAETTKTKRQRVLPLMPVVRAIFERRRRNPAGARLPDDAFVLGNEVGERVRTDVASRRFRAACDAAGVYDLRLRDLRREFASRLKDSGAQLHEVRDARRHCNATMTDKYLATTALHLKEAFARFKQAAATVH